MTFFPAIRMLNLSLCCPLQLLYCHFNSAKKGRKSLKIEAAHAPGISPILHFHQSSAAVRFTPPQVMKVDTLIPLELVSPQR